MSYQLKTNDLIESLSEQPRFIRVISYLTDIVLNGKVININKTYSKNFTISLEKGGDSWTLQVFKKNKKGKPNRHIKKTVINTLSFQYKFILIEPNPHYDEDEKMAPAGTGIWPSLPSRTVIYNSDIIPEKIGDRFNLNIPANSKFEKNLPQHIFKDITLVC